MGDPFRRLFLDQVQVIIAKEAGRGALHELLRMATPDLAEGDVVDEKKLAKLFRALLLRIHPDKHPDDKERVTVLCQNATVFYEECTAAMSCAHDRPKKKKRQQSPTSASFPFEFKVQDNWSFLTFERPYFQAGCSTSELSSLVAFQCINARGAIAHGKRTEICFENADALRNPASLPDILAPYGGSTTLEDEHEIKEELMRGGPVVSTSIQLDDFMRSSPYCNYFSGQSNVLIVGWQLTGVGEVWLVTPLWNPEWNQHFWHQQADIPLIPIAFGQFGIDDVCLAPTNSFENMPWQPGPYLDLDMSEYPQNWRYSSGDMIAYLTSKELEQFGEELGTELFSSDYARTTTLVTVRNRDVKAHSRKCGVCSIKWNKQMKSWELRLVLDQPDTIFSLAFMPK